MTALLPSSALPGTAVLVAVVGGGAAVLLLAGAAAIAGVTDATALTDPAAASAAAGPADPGTCVSPLPGARVTSPFGWRNSPVTHTSELHPGVDLAGGPRGNLGDPILAACPGTVTFAGPATGYGNYVAITTSPAPGTSFVTGYGHMWTVLVTPGQQVAAGQPIAFVGCAGACTGPHLHLEVRPTLWATPVDPVGFFAACGLVIP